MPAGGADPTGVAVRRILHKVGTNNVLSKYSLGGKKTKRAFKELHICRLIIVRRDFLSTIKSIILGSLTEM